MRTLWQQAIAVVALAAKGIRRRALASALTALSVALGVGLSVAVVTTTDSAERSFDALKDASRSFDLILGPPQGSPLQIVLVTLFHVDRAEGRFPWHVYEEMKADPRVATAVPFAVGDTFRGHRVVGTTRDFFTTIHGADDRPLADDVRGRLFDQGFEAVVGSLVAAQTGLRVGDDFTVSHGLEAALHEHAEHWKVVGVLRPTGTPHDRAVFIPIDSFYHVEGHGPSKPAAPGSGGAGEGTGGHEEGDGPEGHGDHDEPAGERQLSAVGLRLRAGGLLKLALFGEIREKRTDVQAAMPEEQVQKLKAIVGDLYRAFRGVAGLVLAVVLVGTLVALYNTIHGRRREIAILRALGARPFHVFAVILVEAVLLCVAGGVAGIVLGRAGALVFGPALQDAYGVRLDVALRPFDLWALLGVVGMGVLAGILPAIRGLTTPVASNLHS